MKKVRFSTYDTIYLVGKSEEDRAARNGLQELRDRQRFQKKIEKIELILNPVLNSKIKKIVYHLLPFDVCID